MKIAALDRGNVGGGLSDLWEKAGHDVARIGKERGDVSDADTAVVAVPGRAIADALENVQGLGGKTVIDATNLIGSEPPPGFASNAEFIKSKTNGTAHGRARQRRDARARNRDHLRDRPDDRPLRLPH
jgi:8-hydroxy-5-deazaflavin:NADPH oxidoreductase